MLVVYLVSVLHHRHRNGLNVLLNFALFLYISYEGMPVFRSFVRIFGSLGGFEYRGEGSLRAWARQIAVNEALKKLRGRKKTASLEYMPEVPDVTEEEEEEENVDKIPPEVLQDMIKALPEGYRTIFNLYVLEEKSHKEIASLLGITESTSASQLHRARALLVKKIKDYRNNKIRQ